MSVKITFIKPYKPQPYNANHSVSEYKEGDELECEKTIADSLVKAKLAEIVKTKKTTKKAK